MNEATDSNPYETPQTSALGSHPQGAPSQSLHKHIKQLQIIAAAILLGISSVVGILLALKLTGGGLQLDFQLAVIPMVAVVVATGALLASFIVPSIIRKQVAAQYGRGKPTEPTNLYRIDNEEFEQLTPEQANLVAGYVRSSIVHQALLEGPAMVAAILFFVSNSAICLGIALFFIAMLIVQFPNKNRVIAWLQSV